ncbi:MAG: hypothetical protein ABMB14_32550, partial [Myxococcota bacterium]
MLMFVAAALAETPPPPAPPPAARAQDPQAPPPATVLHLTRRLIALRSANDALLTGALQII